MSLMFVCSMPGAGRLSELKLRPFERLLWLMRGSVSSEITQPGFRTAFLHRISFVELRWQSVCYCQRVSYATKQRHPYQGRCGSSGRAYLACHGQPLLMPK